MATLQMMLTPETEDCCRREGIEAALRTALELVQEYYPDASGIQAGLMWDLEYPDDEWVSLTFTISGNAEEVAARDDQMLDRRIAAVPRPAVKKVVMLPHVA